ncbi:hypothetical protein FS842_004424 [Serendipita sp. 407]|nr:hypothetical protein FRC15_005188 [Serendipita sp. 397]KAG8774987.1 hypothetical protein FRC16_004953 [Serendipita sp. 398]KAG8841218.1 hypothetical protein FRC20_005140 [Serendipita sp. 405]KAG9030480.1 hypothetical protein FS842_004424 [Serendipita sp. 407]
MYSLALTLLNSRYAKQLLDSLPIPKNIDEQLQFDELRTAVFQALRISQQEPFAVAIRSADSPGGLDLAIVRAWWRSVRESLVKSARWFTASLATQAAWAIIAFAFTWVDAFGPSKVGTNITAFGLAISLCWSWVTVIVLGWYFAGVSFSKSSITDAIEQADKMHPDAFPRLVTYKRPLHDQDRSHFALTRRIAGDVEHPGPIYNYARVLVWSHMVYYLVETIRQDTSLFRTARDQDEQRQHGQQEQEHRHEEQQQQREEQQRQEEEEERQEQQQQEQPGVQQRRWRHEQQGTHELQFLRPPATPERFHSVTSSVSFSAQTLTRSQNADVERGKDTPIVARYLWEDKGVVAQWKRDAYGRMAWAIVCATLLSLMTVGSAFGLDFATPSIGLGCWSGGILIYWMVSYVVLVVLILAALISDLCSVRETRMLHYKMQESTLRGMSYRLMGTIAVALRLLGKLLTFLNSAWIVIHCFFGFTPFYDTCYCLTNRGTTFWLWLDGAQLRDLGNTERFWGGFASATGVTCLFFIIFMRGWTAKRL